ncbi:MAG: alpha/beta hydrolase [Anaerolineae bacterium]|nr:alpha/beta hydrolase [Anaerolineae bacterium]
MQTSYAEVNGGRLYYEMAGEGQVVVLLHAGVADRRMWNAQWEIFAQQYRVIRYDGRGYGKTENPTEPFSPTADLAGLLDILDVPNAMLVGCSMGGRIAIDFALTYPERVRGLVLVASGLRGYKFDRSRLTELDAESNAAMEHGDFAAAAEVDVKVWVIGLTRAASDLPAATLADCRMMLHEIYQRNQHVALVQTDPPAINRLGEIHVPTLILVGASDLPDIAKIADQLARDIPNAEKIVYPGVAHMLNMEIPDQFNADVLAFLARTGLS